MSAPAHTRTFHADMAPEIKHTEPYWEACDVYSLGASCYEMLTGKLPSGRSKPNFWGMSLSLFS